MVTECSLVAVTPWSINPGLASAGPFCSRGSHRVWMLSPFQFVWQLQSPPRSLLSEPGWKALPLVKCLLSGCPEVISHPLSSSIYVASMQKSHFRAAVLLYLSLGCTLRWPILRPCFSLMLRSHDTGCDFSTLAEIIKNFASSSTFSNSFSSVAQLCPTLCNPVNRHEVHARPPCPSPTPGVYSNSCLRSSQIRHIIQVLWPLPASLVHGLLDIRGTYNLVWVWKDTEWKADTQTSLSNAECQ